MFWNYVSGLNVLTHLYPPLKFTTALKSFMKISPKSGTGLTFFES